MSREDMAYAQGLREGRLCQEDRERLQILEIRCESLSAALRMVADVASINYPGAANVAKELLANHEAWDTECEKRRLAREARMTPAQRLLEGR